MRRFLTVAGCLALLLMVLPASGLAQDERGEIGYVMRVAVAPAYRDAYREAVTDLIEAALAAEVSYEWHFWGNEKGFLLYYPVENMAYFDNPMQFWSAFDGTPGEAGRDAFMAEMGQIPARASTEIVEAIPNLRYWPEGYTNEDWNVGHFHFEWLNPGQEEAWAKYAGDFVAFLETIGYPYGVQAYRTLIGEERMGWVFFGPNLSEFYSDANWQDLVEAAGVSWDPIEEQFNDIVVRMTHEDARHIKDMSYVPDS